MSKQRKEAKMATAAKVIPIKDKGEDLARKTVCLVLRFGTFGNSRRVANSKVKVDADMDLINVQKKLLDSKELEAIYKADANLKRQLDNDICLPFDVSIRLVPLARVPEAIELCRDYEENVRPALVEKFMQAYPELCRSASKRLRGVYNGRDYLPPKYVRGKFVFSYQLVSFGVPGQLKDVSAAMFEGEKKRVAGVMREAAGMVEQVRRAALAELVGHLANKLEPDDKRDGKPKIFRDSAVTKLQDFLEKWDVMDVTDDVEMKTLITKGKALLKGVSPEALRTTDTLREKVKADLDKIAERLDGMVTELPGRKFREEPEEEE